MARLTREQQAQLDAQAQQSPVAGFAGPIAGTAIGSAINGG